MIAFKIILNLKVRFLYTQVVYTIMNTKYYRIYIKMVCQTIEGTQVQKDYFSKFGSKI